jgi:hypothetical protein
LSYRIKRNQNLWHKFRDIKNKNKHQNCLKLINTNILKNKNIKRIQIIIINNNQTIKKKYQSNQDKLNNSNYYIIF